KAKPCYAKPPYLGELQHFDRLFSGLIASISEDTIRSHGYVIDTLEASVWCLVKTGSFQEAVLKAVNLGHDTDTTGTVTGGLAGIHYGLKAVPDHWLNQVVRRTDIQRLFESFSARCISDSS
ncbi:ADP-ribosylglycohydrolase family protein, partial [Candidatus Bathyarchaeota archaeon]|nr:ADP-ribosylglycohydrolase family protein [Candidatus Bathyarchaeota archaeon]